MHQPRPYGQAGAVTDGDRAALDALVRQLTNLKQLSGLPSFKLVRALPSGATAIAQDMGGVLKVIVQPQREEAAQTEDEDGLATTDIPMMFSGVIDQGVVTRGAGVTLKLSASTINRLARQRITVGAQVTLQRFAVGLPQQCSELKPSGFDDNANLFTQYANLRPTWWSNGMAEVVQIVGGYGRQDFANLPDTPAERAMLVLPQSVIDDITAELGAVRLPGYTGKPPMDGGIRYDYKFTTTHGVGFDHGGKPWLVRVSMAGVYAMPLPLVPATTTQAFRRYVNDVGDDELLWALNRFGGLPSGESFPGSTGDFEAWRRAGVITKVCEMGDFYEHTMYGSTMGWSFNRKGTEGFNTGYGYEQEVVYSYAYKLHLALGATVNGGRVQEKITSGANDAQALAAYMAGVSNLIQDGSATSLAIHYKMRRAGADAIMQRAQHMSNTSGSYYNECIYWDNLEAPPIASHSASVERTARGAMWSGRLLKLGQALSSFRTPEPLSGGCIPAGANLAIDAVATAEVNDTIVMGFYVGDTLKTVKNSIGPAVRVPNDEPPPPSVPQPGTISWSNGSYKGEEIISYPSDFAKPDPITPPSGITVVVTEGIHDWAVGGAWGVGDNGIAAAGHIDRVWSGRQTTTRTDYPYIPAKSTVTMPFMDRNAALYAVSSAGLDPTLSAGAGEYSVPDPYTYTTGPGPDIGPTSFVTGEEYNPSESSAPFSFSPWLAVGIRVDDALQGLPAHPPALPPFVPPPVPAPTVSHGYVGFSSLSQPLRLLYEEPDPYYFGVQSAVGPMFYRDATKVSAGTCEYASVSGPIGPLNELKSRRSVQGTCRLADNSTAHHFIGVINE